MADLSLSTEQELLRGTARDFIERECPLSKVRGIIEEEGGFSRELWRKTAELGWQGLLVRQEYGGTGGSLSDAAVLFEELGRGCVPGPYVLTALAALLLLDAASPEKRAELLPAIASGEAVANVAEPTAAHVSLPARPGSSPSARSRFDLEGLRVSGQAFLDGREGDDSSVWAAVDKATALLCAYMAGATRRVYEMSMSYAQKRVQFGQPIARFQRVQDRLIDMLNAADAAYWTAHEAVWKLEKNKPDASITVSVAKAVASEGFYRACEDAHHVHAGIGSEKGYGLYLYTQKSRSLYHELGDPAFHRRRLAGLLGL